LVEVKNLKAASAVVSEAVERRDVPGAVALVRRRDETVLHVAFGATALTPAEIAMELDTVFDLASLTKPLATTPVVLALVERGLMDLDESIERFLPELAGSPLAALTLHRLLTHSSGLQAWHPTYTHGTTPVDVLRAITELPLVHAAATTVEYTCLGFILLGIIAERATGRSLDELAESLVFRPLGLTQTGYRPRFSLDRYAWTECGNEFERSRVEEAGLHFHNWRESFYPGSVNDGNAWYGLGGVSGNAGVFSTAADVGILGQMWLNGGTYRGARILSRELVGAATSNLTAELNLGRGLGWQIAGPYAPHEQEIRASGSILPPTAFGHTGFTGTSIWIDPEDELVVVLLTNRVHPEVGDVMTITALRHRFHDAVLSAIKAA
jgi:CubicO group peptidase (beta-lactamase class C family)